jgi:DNA-binding MarR family transcriptional regulator
MTTNAQNLSKTAGMIARLGKLCYSQGFVCGLTAAQWTALRYFATANQFSRTLLAFADYHATTRGTASQTVKSLVSQGFLTRTRSEKDGRSVRFDLTERGRVVHDQDPFKDLVSAIEEIPQGLKAELHSALERVTDRFAHERERPSFGSCAHCSHLEECAHREDVEEDYFCHFENSPIEVINLNQLCVNYEPGAGITKRG